MSLDSFGVQESPNIAVDRQGAEWIRRLQRRAADTSISGLRRRHLRVDGAARSGDIRLSLLTSINRIAKLQMTCCRGDPHP